MSARRLVALVIVALAVGVNYPHVAGWFGGSAEVPTVPPADDEPLAPTAPAPSGVETVVVFQPVLSTGDLPDPFLHDVPAAPAAATAAVQQILPQVTLILRAGGSCRAVVDGRTVGVGDRVAIGTVETIGARQVTVRTPAGNEIELRLPPPGARAAAPSRRADAAPVEAKVPDEDKR